MISRPSRRTVVATLLSSPLLVAAAASADLDQRLAEARRTYDLDGAQMLLAEARAMAPDELVFVDASVLVTELQRLEFETTPEKERDARRDLGERIDATAEEGLAALERIPESSETQRMRADLLGSLIRSKFRGKKHLKHMQRAAERALELDPANALAWVSLAKPPAFRPGRDDADREEALGYLEKALVIDAELEPALLLRGRVLDELGRSDEARRDWSAVLDRNPDCSVARDLLGELGED